jgi:predicted nuclease with RNAse H fold
LPAFAGIDLTCSTARHSAYALLGEGLQVLCLASLGDDPDIVAIIERDRPLLTGIDAPLSMPKSLHCLDDECPCAESPTEKGRQCERELARQGIGCYFTTKKSIIKDMVLRGIHIEEMLTARHCEVIEVYPYATKRRLWGRDIPKKTTARGLDFLRSRLSVIIPGLQAPHMGHDLCDALVAAYTAYLHHHGRTELIGDPDEGQIVIPR